MIETTQPIWSLIADHTMKPEQATFCRIIAAFVKLFDNEEVKRLPAINNELEQFDMISSRAWDQCIDFMSDITSEQVNGYNPNEIQSFDVNLFEKLLDGINGEEIGSEGLPMIITMLYQFIDTICKLYRYTEEEKKKAIEAEAAALEEASTAKQDEEANQETDADAE